MAATRVTKSNVPRVVVLVLGVAGIGYGLLGLRGDLHVPELLNLLAWLGVAVVLHDGVVSALATVGGAALHRITFGLTQSSAGIIRGALLIGAVLTLIVLPLLRASVVAAKVSLNQGPYAAALGWSWLVIAVLSAGAVFLVERRYRRSNRTNDRPES